MAFDKRTDGNNTVYTNGSADDVLYFMRIKSDTDFLFDNAMRVSDKLNEFLDPETKKQRRNEKIGGAIRTAIFGGAAIGAVTKSFRNSLYFAGTVLLSSAVFNYRSDKHYRNKRANTFYKAFSNDNRQRFLQDSFKNNKKSRDFFVHATEMCRDAIKQGKTIDAEFVTKAKEKLVSDINSAPFVTRTGFIPIVG